MKTTSTDYHNRTAHEYDQGYQSPYWQIYNEITWHYIKSVLPRNKDDALILDAGGGTGLWAIKTAELGYKVVMTDIADNMLEMARKKIADEELTNKITILNCDIIDMSQFDNEQFDLSLAEGDTVSYCSDPEKAISELARVTKPGGHVTVSVDNKLNWVAIYYKQGKIEQAEELLRTGMAQMQVKSGHGFDWFPAYMFTVQELETLFRKCNLEPVKAVGKPVFTPFDKSLENGEIYKCFLDLELEFSSLPSVAGKGGHIALIGKKL